MSSSESARAAVRRTRLAVVAAPVVAGLALTGVLDRPHAGTPVMGSAADGAVVDGTTVFDDVPAVDNLDPRLLHALRQAATAAADDGVTFDVNSGWRSAAYQQRLLDQAIAKYGSKAAAARWVDTPTTSAHVSGDAVDLAHDAAAWLAGHGAAFGLCQIYRNEAWHYELRPAAAEDGCPPMYADPTDDPRTQQ